MVEDLPGGRHLDLVLNWLQTLGRLRNSARSRAPLTRTCWRNGCSNLRG